jgi:hypothetical protein
MPSAPLSLVEALAAQDESHGAGEDPQIERERLVLDVPDVKLDPFAPGE